LGRAIPDVARLEAAVLGQAEAARSLGEALARARSALEHLDLQGFRGAMSGAELLADALRQSGAACALATRRVAAGAGLAEDSRLGEVVRRLEPRAEAIGGAEELQRALETLGLEAAALGIAARYGNRVCAHLVGLQRGASGAGYDVRGRFTQATATSGRRA
jgi:hypothetical protein